LIFYYFACSCRQNIKADRLLIQNGKKLPLFSLAASISKQ